MAAHWASEVKMQSIRFYATAFFDSIDPKQTCDPRRCCFREKQIGNLRARWAIWEKACSEWRNANVAHSGVSSHADHSSNPALRSIDTISAAHSGLWAFI